MKRLKKEPDPDEAIIRAEYEYDEIFDRVIRLADRKIYGINTPVIASIETSVEGRQVSFPMYKVLSVLHPGHQNAVKKPDKPKPPSKPLPPAKPARPETPNIKRREQRDKDYFRKKSRESRDRTLSLGMFYTSCAVPETHRQQFFAYVKRIRAEHMVKLCETLSSSDPVRMQLANKNFARVPLLLDITTMQEKEPNAAVKYKLKECAKMLEEFYRAKNAIELANKTSDDAVVIVSSTAVAYSHLTAAMWEEIQLEVNGETPGE